MSDRGSESGEMETVRDSGSLRQFFAAIPNMVLDDRRLSPFAVRLYAHYKRRAGDDGECFESNAEVAVSTGMSVATVKRARDQLAGLEYIDVQVRTEFGLPTLITIRDIWPRNMATYSGGGSHRATPVALTEPGVAPPEPGGGSHRAHKKNPSRRTPEEESQTLPNARVSEERLPFEPTEIGDTEGPASKLVAERDLAEFERLWPGIDVRREYDKFLDYNRAKGRRLRDQLAGFRNWLRKAEEFQHERERTNGPGGTAAGARGTHQRYDATADATERARQLLGG